ncbi:MAG: BlaI/MecI/CopY family transcriptional regulator [Pseudomonadota bacterium]
MNKKVHLDPLPKREQQVLDLVFRLGRATVRDIQRELPDAPTYSATRMLLQRLHKKAQLTVERDGARYVYLPRLGKTQAGRAALQNLLKNFFDDSPARALSALIAEESIDQDELAELELLVAKARAERE